ncbi:MAG: hypothetical protein Ct9H90mP6_12120 [Gammaproteobacteria bacterium]|nr:MAG: hypothetical protein Ct9H90mP6_12120 [Gammaproteobacteria bacterium]
MKFLNFDIQSNWKKKEFENAVLLAKDFIKKGDIFQIVISQKFNTQINNEPFDLYRSLRMVNPSPYMSFFDFGAHGISLVPVLKLWLKLKKTIKVKLLQF